MADISSIQFGSNVYNMRDYRLPVFSSSTTTTYLRGDGTWAAPSFPQGVQFIDNNDHLLVIIPS